MKKIKKNIKIIVIYLSKKFVFFRKIIRKTLNIRRSSRIRNFKNLSVDENLIIFESFMGKAYSDSPKAIYEYLKCNNKYKNFNFVWAFKEVSEYEYLNDDRTQIVRYGSLAYYETYAKAKYWFTNSRIPDHIIKKEGQIYVQCWHGTPLKRLCHDIKTDLNNALNTLDELKEKYDADTIRYNYMISPSKFTSEKYRSAFNLKNVNPQCKIVEKGYPRNDFLFTYSKKDIKNIKNKIGINNNKKIILYAPTWRDNQHSAKSGYTLNLAINFDNLYNEIGNEYIILFRTHAFISNSFNFKKYEGFVYDVSKYDDIAELYVISDILITDYSSVFFDFANLKRPMLFYMYDLELYQNKLRDFYFDLKELPGPIVETEEKLVAEIKQLSSYNNKYQNKYQKFNDKFNYLDDANSSKRVVEEVFR